MRTAALALLGLALAPAVADTPLVLQPQSRLWVDGTSTVRRFTCAAGVLNAEVAGKAGAVPAVLAGEKAVRTVEVHIPAARLDCKNGTMNEHMLKAIKAKEHGEIVFTVSAYDLAAADGGVTGTLTGTLALGGVTRTIAVEATGKEAGPGALRVAGTHALKLSDYGLKAPSLMLGTMKVGDVVTVGFDLVLKGEPTVAATHN
ncbi:YceI family protein [Roseisolibacter sp. H3M3-2]|uniref:YceI family protein n=1 Tax=Roseisolibacter sp. H3M3-2 TaxID=3031323 RepID=UPI0023DBA14A|nr:YceI family protein [Roseisolibacter sp. H3M3-2]MDF1504005.1 YceI family protein [Roseisolibacter sp. H3M3-2]